MQNPRQNRYRAVESHTNSGACARTHACCMRSNPSHTPTHTHFTLLQPRFRCAIRRQCGCHRAKTFLDRDWKRKRRYPLSRSFSLSLFLSFCLDFTFTSWHFLLPPLPEGLKSICLSRQQVGIRDDLPGPCTGKVKHLQRHKCSHFFLTNHLKVRRDIL